MASFLAGPEIEVGGVDPAAAAGAAIEELQVALAERDSAVVESFFGENVVPNSYLGFDFVGPGAAAYLLRISVPMTIEDISEPVQNDDGSSLSLFWRWPRRIGIRNSGRTTSSWMGMRSSGWTWSRLIRWRHSSGRGSGSLGFCEHADG